MPLDVASQEVSGLAPTREVARKAQLRKRHVSRRKTGRKQTTNKNRSNDSVERHRNTEDDDVLESMDERLESYDNSNVIGSEGLEEAEYRWSEEEDRKLLKGQCLIDIMMRCEL